MTISKKIKKVLLLLQLVEVEEEEFTILDRQYSIEFENDFLDESDYLRRGRQKNIHQNKAQRKEIEVPDAPKMKKEELKVLHRKLAKVTHPDLAGKCSEEAFKKIQKAYDNGDGATLLKEAYERKIVTSISELSYDSMGKNLNARRKLLDIKKSTVQWMWCKSDKSLKVRKKIQELMRIDRKLFKKWIAHRNHTQKSKA